MIEGPIFGIAPITARYDALARWYRLLVSEHIHHGYWDGAASLRAAQARLVERFADFISLSDGSCVLDIGCGTGGAALWLASERKCRVLGISISPKQVALARREARRRGLADAVHFEVFDANALSTLAAGFDVVWVLECAEHLPNRKTLLENCAAKLSPGGSVGVCGWAAADRALCAEEITTLASLCSDMCCYPLDRAINYAQWMEEAGLEVVKNVDWTEHVKRTADCALGRNALNALKWFVSPSVCRFLEGSGRLKQAYATGALRYFAIVGKKSL